jgi:hypothetical protein
MEGEREEEGEKKIYVSLFLSSSPSLIHVPCSCPPEAEIVVRVEPERVHGASGTTRNKHFSRTRQTCRKQSQSK